MKVLCPMEGKDGRTFWMRLGSAYQNADGSYNVYLDALPVNRKLQLRELDEKDTRPREAVQPPSETAPQEHLPF
jgi:hypothetical protein